ncbi:MAG: phosphoribosylaminoimidazolesuccinocarboxamide synthase [Candidatus Hermodarchaeota archaeon]
MKIIQGKNKDGYSSDGKIKFVFSDRLSVFDEVIGKIEGRGKILAECTRVIFNYLSKNNIKTAMLEGGDDYIIMYKCNPLDFEFIFRNLLTGSALQRALNGTLKLPRDMECKEYSRFPQVFVEVSTKKEVKDRYNLDRDDIWKIMKESFSEMNLDNGMLLYKNVLEEVKVISHLLTELFDKAGLILVDGKIEMGLSGKDELCVIDSFGPDEFRTFDRIWLKGDKKAPPDYYDKEFIREKLRNANKNEYKQILQENASLIINRYKEVTTRLKQATK